MGGSCSTRRALPSCVLAPHVTCGPTYAQAAPHSSSVATVIHATALTLPCAEVGRVVAMTTEDTSLVLDALNKPTAGLARQQDDALHHWMGHSECRQSLGLTRTAVHTPDLAAPPADQNRLVFRKRRGRPWGRRGPGRPDAPTVACQRTSPPAGDGGFGCPVRSRAQSTAQGRWSGRSSAGRRPAHRGARTTGTSPRIGGAARRGRPLRR
jgi:hypothetical protein